MWKSKEKLTVHFETIVSNSIRRISFSFLVRAIYIGINEQLDCASFAQKKAILPFLLAAACLYDWMNVCKAYGKIF